MPRLQILYCLEPKLAGPVAGRPLERIEDVADVVTRLEPLEYAPSDSSTALGDARKPLRPDRTEQARKLALVSRKELLVVWLSNKNHTTRLALRAPSLLVHFSGDEVEKLALCRWEPGR